MMTGILVCYLTLLAVLCTFDDSDVLYLGASTVPIVIAVAIVSFDT